MPESDNLSPSEAALRSGIDKGHQLVVATFDALYPYYEISAARQTPKQTIASNIDGYARILKEFFRNQVHYLTLSQTDDTEGSDGTLLTYRVERGSDSAMRIYEASYGYIFGHFNLSTWNSLMEPHNRKETANTFKIALTEHPGLRRELNDPQNVLDLLHEAVDNAEASFSVHSLSDKTQGGTDIKLEFRAGKVVTAQKKTEKRFNTFDVEKPRQVPYSGKLESVSNFEIFL